MSKKVKAVKKRSAPTQVIVSLHPYGEIQVFKSAKDAFENGENIVYIYELVKKQQLVVKIEDVK